jgi:DNA repair protein RadC
LRQKFLKNKLVDYELLELLLTYAIPRRDVRPLARELTAEFGGVYGVLTAPIESLTKIGGLKQNTAVLIKAIHELMLAGYRNYLDDTPIFHDYQKVADYCKLMLAGKQIEEFHIFYLDSNHKLLKDDLHSSGTVDWSAVYTREIVKRALELNARSVILIHNHPTPGMTFSTEDAEITISIKKILESVNVNMFDHLLVSGGTIYSARNLSLLEKVV